MLTSSSFCQRSGWSKIVPGTMTNDGALVSGSTSRGEHDSAVNSNTASIGTDEHARTEVIGDGNLRSRVTHEELCSARGFELIVLGEPAAVGGPLRSIVDLQVDGRVCVLALPRRLGGLETV